MSKDEELEMLIMQVLNAAVSAIPAYLQDIEQNKEQLMISDSKEFVYGMIIGMALGLGSVLFTDRKTAPTNEDQLKIREIIYKNMPEVKKRIFND